MRISINGYVAFDAMRAQVREHGMPEAFSGDFWRHDMGRLCESMDAPYRFGWVLRPSGTELLDARMRPKSLAGYIEHYATNRGERYRFYTWDGATLRYWAFDQWRKRMERWNREDGDHHASKALANY